MTSIITSNTLFVPKTHDIGSVVRNMIFKQIVSFKELPKKCQQCDRPFKSDSVDGVQRCACNVTLAARKQDPFGVECTYVVKVAALFC
jgi:hypothetical protein